VAGYRQLLFSRAFRVVPGREYNEISHRLRESRNVFFYEVILLPDAPWEFLRDRVYPFLVRLLRSKSLDPETTREAAVSLFFEDRFYLLEAPEFLKAYAEIEDLDPEAFRARMREWQSGEEKGETPEERNNFRPDLPAVRR